MRRVLADCGDGRLDKARLDAHWREPWFPFLLTVWLWGDDHWSSYEQTSRPGYNLVLRLNFSQHHDRRFEQWFKPYYQWGSLNGFYLHPVLGTRKRHYFRHTLAWARLDIDLEQGEALIEEIQTDWVREAMAERRTLARCDRCERESNHPVCHKAAAARRYLDEVLSPYARIWDEAMLSAALFFLHEELGLHRIWYHTWQTGNACKGIAPDFAPPRSLYQRLPRHFCFTETERMPQILQNRASQRRLRKARVVEPRFYHLEL